MPQTAEHIADHLQRLKDEILARWRETVVQACDKSRKLAESDERKLFDHLPALTDALIAILRGELSQDVEHEFPSDLQRDSRNHGHQRRVNGFSVVDVLVELTIYRRAVFDTIDEIRDPDLDTNVLATVRRSILDLLDVSVRCSIDQFHREAEREREAAAAEAHQLEEQRERFLGTLSHELRNQISPILLAVELAKDAGLENPRVRHAIEVIERQAQHQSFLINDLLDFNRIRFGKTELQRKLMDLRDSIRHAVEAMEGESRAKSLQLELDILQNPIFAYADPARMAQVAVNLLSNAVKFTSPGGKIIWRAAQESGWHVLTISDNGIGIKHSDLSRIFDMFYQANVGPSRRIGGLGIGLAIARNLIELHGGTIEAKSRGEGMGAEFVVRLPAAEAPATTQESQLGRVLIVEDNADQLDALSEVLAARGFEPLTAHDGFEALSVAARMHPSVVIMDIAMPRMDGLELARRFNEHPELRRNLKLIALTGFGSAEDRRASQEAGIDHYLIKPVNINELVRLLRNE